MVGSNQRSDPAKAILDRLDALRVPRQRMTVDSRALGPGDVFVALAGSRVDGRKFIEQALLQGAAAVLSEAGGAGAAVAGDEPRVIAVPGLPALLGEIADRFYDRPSSKLKIFGVTGTNGKTSIASWIAQALSLRDMSCGVMGTLGVSLGATHWPTHNTTPDAATVHTFLRDLHAAGAKAVAMEVSSHALALGRVAGVRFDTVVFSNLTQDHLDFHGSMAAYGAAKAKLFTDYAAQQRVINADDAFGADLIALALPGTISYGLERGDVRGRIEAMTRQGMRLRLDRNDEQVIVETSLIVRFNAYNLLAVAAVLLGQGWSLAEVGAVLSRLNPAPGRMQRVDGSELSAPSVYIDYAHTPDALVKALDTVRETQPTSLAVVFGCGGDRDRSKRPLMGRIARDRADQVYVTSDNPRSEVPEAIIADIVAGIESEHRAALHVEPDRHEAIRLAIHLAPSGSAVLIAGKGHETYQEIAGVRREFSDVDEARAALSTWQSPNARSTRSGGSHVAG